jgi:hypothetical protein
MTDAPIVDEKSAAIFIVCLFYAVHMVEEFSFGFVEWADRYFGRFDWKQNLLQLKVYPTCNITVGLLVGIFLLEY